MPIYRYRCPMCALEADEFRKIDGRDDLPICPRDGEPMGRRIMPTMVQADIESYRSVAIDKETGRPAEIHSRRQHREFLKRNDYIEVGNDFGTPKKKDEGPADAPMLSVKEMKQQGFVEESL